ncbi:phage tail protein [Guyparkeria sp. 1SP6A2]|nr:phage tail protein [Guyparkeria sp. 1SP6A2]
MAVTITITDAGRAAIVDAENTGTDPVTIAEIGIGNGSYTAAPDATATALKAEIKRLTTISGEIVADDTFHVTVKDEGNDTYDVTEFGLYLADGTLFAIYAVTSGNIMQKAAASSVLLAVDIIITTANATSLTFGDTSFTNPPASETVKGVIEIADDAEALAGDDLLRAMPSKRVHAAFKQFGLGSDGVKITDANAAVLGGDYYHDATAANIPLAAAGTIHVSAGGANDAEALTQTWIQSSDTDEHRMFVRHRRGVANGWSAWKELTHPDFLHASSGYDVLPSGLIIQWGATPGSNSDDVIFFPIAFPNSVFSLSGAPYTSVKTLSPYSFDIYDMTTTRFNQHRFDINGADVTNGFLWVAIGN